MSFTGDSIIIKSDFSFERIENLKKGDLLLNPFGEKSEIENIETFYSTNGYEIKTENFFKINIAEDSKIYTAPIKNIYDKKTNMIKKILLTENFKSIYDVNEFDYFGLNNLNIKYVKNFEELELYSKILLKGKINGNEIIVKNLNSKFNNINENSKFNLNINNKKEIFFHLNKNNISTKFFNNFNNQIYQRKLDSDIFITNIDEIKSFIEFFLIENTKMYISMNQFRINIPSKIMTLQLFYLINYITLNGCYVEQIKKNNYKLKDIKASNKKNIYSITKNEDMKKIINVKNFYWQKQEHINKNNRNLKYYKIKTKNNKSFYVYNLIFES